MNRRNAWKLLYLLVAAALLPLGTDMAQAGPGGGTYYANSPAGGASGTALRKFVDKLPGVGLPGCTKSSPPGIGTCNENNLGNYIPVASKVTGRPGVPADLPTGNDYYEIGLVEYAQKMHSDLPKKTKLRGYRDLSPAFANQSTQYLGPLIIATKDKPVRIKFTNMLPTGAAGNLFIPVDTTLMGAGPGPYTDATGTTTCAQTMMSPYANTQTITENCSTNVKFTQNRATIHLHGGNSPWISDGTPHQWITPAGETSVPAQMRKGVGVQNVPDMWFDPATGNSVAPGTPGAVNDPGAGSMTFFWTNQQSNRLMFYHDHSLGITRLNVYAGEAAGYLITDAVEEDLINRGILPNICAGGATAVCEYRYGIPLIIQDKTFVPQNIAVQDAKWDLTKWGQPGDLWFPHVYEPNQDPTSPAGANPFGRWDYGPWFWPPVSLDPSKTTLPTVSTTPEAFMDTMVVNGTAYPYLNVEPKPYRFRILNATNDRMLNLSLFVSDPNDPLGTEVKMVAAAPTPTFPAGPFPAVANWPTDGRAGGVPDPATRGPNLIQIGTESGFLPNPVVHPNQPVGYDYNRRSITVLNVLEKNLFIGSAERADVIIDFSDPKFIGKNIILYNDAPAPVPAGDPRQDYYTGNPDQTASGGAPSTLRGYGPNTRTIMQFRVAGTPAPNAALLPNLKTELPLAFKKTQPAPLVPEPTYPITAWGVTTPPEQYVKIQDYTLTTKPLNRDYTQSAIPVTIPFQSKAIQELWDPYGRMNATLGVELPFTSQFNQTTIPMGYAEPATELIVDGHPQIWKITHNGVDSHPVHFHMFDVQVINRVGWDGAIRPADDNELGWKETVRMNPLEDIIVAVRPKAQTLPFVLPVSQRPIDPTQPGTATLPATDIGNLAAANTSIKNVTTGLTGFTPAGTVFTGQPNAGVSVTIKNDTMEYGYEYVWHCHILGHEENDFMRPLIFSASTGVPPNPSSLNAYLFGGPNVPGKAGYINPYANPNVNQIVLQWTDGALISTPSRFLVQRSVNGGAFADLAEISFLTGWPPIYTDTSVDPAATYNYQVYALNDFGALNTKSTLPATLAAPVTTGTWLPATSVTLTDSKPIGHVVGTNVSFTASAAVTAVTQPTNVAYQYRFLVNNVEVQAFSASSLYTLPDTTPVGSYTVTVEARTSASQNPVASTSVTHAIINPPNPPTTVATPVPAVYSAPPVVVALTATAPNPAVPVQGIYYTLDGSMPTTAMPPYTGPITLNQTTTINYFAVDVNGTAEAVHTDTWYIHAADLAATMQINNGATLTKGLAVTLNLNAFDPVGVATMEFSNDGTNWSGEEPYATTKLWTLTTGSDGPRTVYARFRDKSLPTGVQYAPITATITLDTTPPVTTPSPTPGTYMNGSALSVILTASETATIYYTIDGTTPTTASLVYAKPILVNTAAGSSTTIKYFAIDSAGNVEAVKTSVWSMATIDLTASMKINNGATWTPKAAVTLNIKASDPSGIASYELSNNGTTWSGPFASPDTTAGANLVLSPSWTLDAPTVEGLKTVYVRFTDTNLGGGTTYPPITATILLGAKDGLIPGTSSHLASALKALQIDRGLLSPGPLDLVHADVAPYVGGAAQPDGKIDMLDAYVIMLHGLGLISTF